MCRPCDDCVKVRAPTQRPCRAGSLAPWEIRAGKGRARPVGPRRSALAAVGRRNAGLSPTPPEEWIFVGHVPAIISAEQFAQVQEKLRTNQRRARRNNRVHPYLLGGLVSCGCCRMACSGQTRRGYS